MDEYLKTVNVWAISFHNISAYIRKNGKHACVIDVMALIMDREPYTLNQTLKYMLDTYPCPHSQVDFSNGSFSDKEIGMKVEDLVPFLCNVPGRDSLYRFYRYAEALLKYLDGDQFLIQIILNARNQEDERIFQTINKRKHGNDDYKTKIKRMRDFELFIQENTNFPDGYSPSNEYFAQIEEIKKSFYNLNFDESIEMVSVNEKRKEEVENFMYIEEATKLKKTDEITFKQVILSLGYEDDFFKRIKCYEHGDEKKAQKGHKKIAKKGREAAYIFTSDDLGDMREIVHRVYSEFRDD